MNCSAINLYEYLSLTKFLPLIPISFRSCESEANVLTALHISDLSSDNSAYRVLLF